MRLRKLNTLVATLALCGVGIAVAPPAFAADSDPVTIPDEVLRTNINRGLAKQLDTARADDAVITKGDMAKLEVVTTCIIQDKDNYPYYSPSRDLKNEPTQMEEGARCTTNLEGLQHATNLKKVYAFKGADSFVPVQHLTAYGSRIVLGDKNHPITAMPAGQLSGQGEVSVYAGSTPLSFESLANVTSDDFGLDMYLLADAEHDFSAIADKPLGLSLTFSGSATKAPASLEAVDGITSLYVESDKPIDFSAVTDFPNVERFDVNQKVDFQVSNLPSMPKVTGMNLWGLDVNDGTKPLPDFTALDLSSFPNLKSLDVKNAHVDLRGLKGNTAMERLQIEGFKYGSNENAKPIKVKFNQDIFARMKNLNRLEIDFAAFNNADQCNLLDMRTFWKKNTPQHMYFKLGNLPVDDYGVFPLPKFVNKEGEEARYFGINGWEQTFMHNEGNGFGRISVWEHHAASFTRPHLFGSGENFVIFTQTPTRNFGPENFSPDLADPDAQNLPFDYVGTPLPADYVFPERNTDLSECKAIGAMVDDPVVTDGSGRAASVLSVDEGSRLPDSTDGSDGESHQVRLELKNVYGETVKHGAYYLWDRASGADKNRLDYLTLRLKPGDPANEGFVSEGEGQNIWIEPLALDTDGSRSSNLDKPAVYTAKVRSAKAGSPVLEAVYNDNVFTLAPTAVVPFGNPPTPVNPDPGTGGDSGNTPGTGGDDTGTTPGAGDNPGTGDTPGSNPDAGGAATGSGDASSTGGVAAPKAPTGAGLATTGFDGVRLLLVSSMLIVLGGVTLYRRRV